tara:strand:- start:715 stop:963 length:249 start_codon:yes stop_codon:yes gene_type:complete
MGILVDLAEWKKKKADEAHARELEEIAQLREDIKRMMEELGEPNVAPYFPGEGEDESAQRLVKIMLTTLDGYRGWPIDSSDM